MLDYKPIARSTHARRRSFKPILIFSLQDQIKKEKKISSLAMAQRQLQIGIGTDCTRKSFQTERVHRFVVGRSEYCKPATGASGTVGMPSSSSPRSATLFKEASWSHLSSPKISSSVHPYQCSMEPPHRIDIRDEPFWKKKTSIHQFYFFVFFSKWSLGFKPCLDA